MLVQRLKRPGPHGKPTLRGQSVRGNRWPEQRYQSPPAARLDHDHRGGSEKNASEQLSAIPRRRTMRRQNWRFRRKLVSGGFNRNARVQTSLRPPKSALPHRCALVRSSASAQHVPSRPDCIPRTFRDRAIRCCRFWVSHPKSGLSRRATHSCSLRALFASHHPPLRPPLWTHAPIVISACDALQMRQYASLRSAMSVR